jgi:hypothetical protein
MIGLLYLQYALLTLALLIWAVQLCHRIPTLAATLSVPVAAGLLYDNVVLALGAILAAGPLLFALNWPRYLLEALAAPLFIPIFADLARRGGASRLAARPARLLVAAITLALMIYGLVGLVGLTLVPVVSGGGVRYVSAEFDAPVIGVAITLAGLLAGAAIWRARGWPWLAIAAIIVLVASGLSAALAPETICPVTNALEIVLMAGALECERRLRSGFAPRVNPLTTPRRGSGNGVRAR